MRRILILSILLLGGCDELRASALRAAAAEHQRWTMICGHAQCHDQPFRISTMEETRFERGRFICTCDDGTQHEVFE